MNDDTNISEVPGVGTVAPAPTKARKELTPEQKAAKSLADKARRAAAKARRAAAKAPATEPVAAEAPATEPVAAEAPAPAPKAKPKTEGKKAPPTPSMADLLDPPKAKAPKVTKADKAAAKAAADMLEPPKDPVGKPGVKGKEEFAKRFGKGDPIRFLAFRIQTSLRTVKDGPYSVEQIATKMMQPVSICNQALELLKVENRVKIRTVKGVQVYDKP